MTMADPSARPSGRASLARADWRYVEAPTMQAMSEADWALLDRQRPVYYAERQAQAVLRMLETAADEPSFGYRVNSFVHGLQTATMLLEAGYDEETVVVGLLHDIGFVACPDTHGAFAAALLGPYISDANRWMLEHHQVFQNPLIVTMSPEEKSVRERYRGHPACEWTATFVDRFDQVSTCPNYPTLKLAAFAPMVERLFAKPPRAIGRG
jgi:predicted HD phosphohydrolase